MTLTAPSYDLWMKEVEEALASINMPMIGKDDGHSIFNGSSTRNACR